MKLAINYLNGIDGIGITQSISFVFFFAIFLFVLYYVLRTKNSYYTPISEMPLDDDATEAYSENEMK
jgi:cbb3-type cytochrome oxidase subunit 3